MRPFLTSLVLIAFTLPAIAAEESKPKADNGPDKGAGAPGTNVEMPYLMAPMTDADGKLSGYAYISMRLTATSDVNALAVRDKLAFVQDAFVRDVNGPGVAKKDDPETVDQPGLAQRLLADAKKIMGPGKVASIAITQVQIAPLHPVETPALNTPPPENDSPVRATGTPK
ncbi:MAG TPA: hypothetical protein VG501_05215 [Rhizomicrobium sp.]|nr:hypothetical protein [Rhizomicrobium sp.]